LTRPDETGLIVAALGETMSAPSTRLYGLASARAPFLGPRAEVLRFFQNVARENTSAESRERILRALEAIAVGSGIAHRSSVIPDYTCAHASELAFYPKNWKLEPFPTTQDRMRVFERESVELASRAAEGAIADARIHRARITHVIVTTCTGFFAPGPDVHLVERLGLRANVARTVIGFMGCFAGFVALRTADQIVRAEPDAVVLSVSVELCTLHYQRDANLRTQVANCLFGDGASASLFARAGGSGGRADVVGSASFLAPDSREQMSWRIGDHGFVMSLDTAVPATLAHNARGFASDLFQRAGTRREDVTGFAIHPGGRKILEEIGRALELREEDLESSYAVLRDHGNMSSATIGFVIEEELARLRALGRSGDVAMLGFGPGLAMEGAVLRLAGQET
jgi:predicted naringenin-chalcone synthase